MGAWTSITGFHLAGAPYGLRFILIPTPVAIHAVLIVGDALFEMFSPDVGASVFVTAIAGVSVVSVVDMATTALGVVGPIQSEVVTVLDGGWRPALLGVTGSAIGVDIQTDDTLGFARGEGRVSHRLVPPRAAGLTEPRWLSQQGVDAPSGG